jgi:hypothetical protein
MMRWQICSVIKEEVRTLIEWYGETEIELGKISCVYNTKEFCDCLISAVNITMMYHDDIDQWNKEEKGSSIISNEWHLKAMPEELAHKWNIGIQTAKGTIHVMTQCGIRMAIHPMTRCIWVNHLNLHQQQLRGTWYTDTLLLKVKSKFGNMCANIYTQGRFTHVIPDIPKGHRKVTYQFHWWCWNSWAAHYGWSNRVYRVTHRVLHQGCMMHAHYVTYNRTRM